MCRTLGETNATRGSSELPGNLQRKKELRQNAGLRRVVWLCWRNQG